MKRYVTTALVGAALCATGAFAQSHQQGSHNPALKDGSPHAVASAARGANSFTEDQAQGRLKKAGFSRVSALKKDDHGVWRGMAYKGRSKVRVGVDYKGNVVR
ncbi:hypothetical protein [Sphingomonas aerophila]|uniref:PepSY domain-containing protein n=1 Tax=Sphingomonas aerophila TaxID=1344948 RepID=A0A7W9EW23_9SPHN|nr:hypothetical protein [Sphingomonas aerophila]MBB5716840.1 hypothetical protein [Sphingomonas aerophila]